MSDTCPKVKLIKAIQERSRSWQAMATSTALDLARNPDDKQLQSLAARYVFVNDESKKLADDIIQLVHGHWPVEKESTALKAQIEELKRLIRLAIPHMKPDYEHACDGISSTHRIDQMKRAVGMSVEEASL